MGGVIAVAARQAGWRTWRRIGVGRVVVDAGVVGGGRRVYRVGVDSGVSVGVYAWTRARCVAMRCSSSGSVVRGWAWCCRVSGGGDAGKAAACDLSRSLRLSLRESTALSKTLRFPRREERGDSRQVEEGLRACNLPEARQSKQWHHRDP